MRQILFYFVTAAVLFFLPGNVSAKTVHLDSKSSSVIFQVKQLAGQVIGGFRDFNGTMEVDGGQIQSVKVDIQTASVFTRHLQRDWDLLGSELFDAAAFPKATFVSQQAGGGAVKGDLTLRGKTKPVTLNVSPLSSEEVFLLEGKISRKDFGIIFNRKMDDGRMLLAEEVDIRVVIRIVP